MAEQRSCHLATGRNFGLAFLGFLMRIAHSYMRAAQFHVSLYSLGLYGGVLDIVSNAKKILARCA